MYNIKMINSIYLNFFFVLLTTSWVCKGDSFTTKATESLTTLRSVEGHVYCASNKHWWDKKGVDQSKLPDTPFEDDNHLTACAGSNHQQQTCCNVAMETKLASMATKSLNNVLRNVLRKMEKDWKYYIKNFQKMFLSEVDLSENDLQVMYSRTYGDLYLNNSHIFTDFFQQLRTHLDLPRPSRRLPSPHMDTPEDTVDRFFKALMWKMLTLFPDMKSLATDRYYNKFEMCTKRHMNEARTFADIPMKVRNDLQKSFAIAQSFLHALIQGKIVLNNLIKMDLNDHCKEEFTRMMYCQHCTPLFPSPHNSPSAQHPSRPCQSSCLRVLSSCLHPLQPVNHAWNNYIKSLSTSYNRLKSPIINLASSLRPLSVKISEAIMNFQEDKDNILIELNNLCDMRRMKRSMEEDMQTNTETHRDMHRERHRARNTHNDRDIHRHTRVTKKTRGVEEDAALVTSHFENNALSATNFILHAPALFCSSVHRSKSQKKVSNDLDDDPGCWNASSKISNAEEGASDKRRGNQINSVLNRLAMFEEQADRKHEKKKKKMMKATPTTTTTTTAAPIDEENYFENPVEDEYASGYDDYDLSGYEEEDEEYKEDEEEEGDEDEGYKEDGKIEDEGGLQDGIVSYNKFPNFNNNNGFDGVKNNDNKFNLPNNNNNFPINNFNKKAHYSHKHNSYNNDNKFNNQHKTQHHFLDQNNNIINNNINNNNNKLNKFNKDIMDETKFYKHYMNKSPYIRPNSFTPKLHPPLSFFLLQLFSLSYFITFL